MANTALTIPVFEQVMSLSKLHLVRQLGFMLLLASGIALGTAVVLWSREPDYVVLYPDLVGQDAAAVMTALDQAGTEYRVDPRTGLLSVPAETLQQTRLQLASQGLPRSTASGFDLLYEESALGTSNFLEQARYTRALEQELVKTIKLIRGVRDARVHLSIPKQSTFLRSSNRGSASVMLDIAAGQGISDNQIAGIAHLVASSVTGVEIDSVSIVDQKGALLSRRQDSELSSSSEHLQYTRNLEQEYTQRIIDILTPVVGEGNVRAQVTADLDFTVIETTEENYTPDTLAIRSEQTSEEARANATTTPGALTPAPPVIQPDGTVLPAEPVATAGADNTQTRSDTTRNYEIDKSTSYVRSSPGGIRRLSVAVLVNMPQPAVPAEGVPAEADAVPVEGAPAAVVVDTAALDAEKIARLTLLVKDSIGYSEARGDSINVINEPFSIPPAFEAAAATPIWQEAWVPGVLKQFAASLVVLMLIFAVLRPALKSVVLQRPAGGPELLPHAEGAATLSPGQGGLLAKPAPVRSEYDENLSLAQHLVENEPARAARMIKEWVAND